MWVREGLQTIAHLSTHIGVKKRFMYNSVIPNHRLVTVNYPCSHTTRVDIPLARILIFNDALMNAIMEPAGHIYLP